MNYTDNAINILTTQTYKGIGKAWIVKNLKGNESVETIVFLLNRAAKESNITIRNFENNRNSIETKLQKSAQFMDGVVALGDHNFPSFRGTVKNSEQPIAIFYRGDLSLLSPSNKNITVIGLLNPDHEIEIIEQSVVAELVKNGATVVSGLAVGCDTIAHRQALRSKGKTIAILPSPLNGILPATNKELADEIVKNKGLLITEYYEDFRSKMELNSRYQERDRLQALFSDCVILSASYSKNDVGCDSGSRLAMGYALDYSIPISVIYDQNMDVDNPMYNLNRQMIRENTETIIINRDNIAISVKKILSSPKKTHFIPNRQSQLNLFG